MVSVTSRSYHTRLHIKRRCYHHMVFINTPNKIGIVLAFKEEAMLLPEKKGTANSIITWHHLLKPDIPALIA